jgi:hypothetical protein
MGWPYQFVDLTEAQKVTRRTLLDTYGLVAQVSAGVVLILIQLILSHNGPDGKGTALMCRAHQVSRICQKVAVSTRRLSQDGGGESIGGPATLLQYLASTLVPKDKPQLQYAGQSGS